LHRLEEVQILESPLGAIDQRAVVRIAFGDVEFAPDHVIAGADIAADIDALDIGARALVDDKGDIDGAGLRIAVAARADGGERIAAPRHLDGHVLDGLFDRLAVVDVALAHAHDRPQRLRVDGTDVGLNVGIAEVVDRPFLDRKRDDEALLAGVVFGDGQADLHAGKAVLEEEAADQIAVGFHAVGVVDVGGLQEAQEIGLYGLDHLFQAPRRIGFIADEIDRLDAGLLTLVDHEDQIDAVVRPLDHLRHHGDVEAAVAVIDVDDALGVGLHLGARQRVARFRLDFLLELLVLHAAVAFEGKPVDHRRFHHRDDDVAARLGDVDVFEQAGGVERFERGIDFGGIEPLAGPNLEIGAHRFGFDAAVALDHDAIGGPASLGRRRGICPPGRQASKPHTQEQAGQNEPPSHPHTHVHALSAFTPNGRPQWRVTCLDLPYVLLA